MLVSSAANFRLPMGNLGKPAVNLSIQVTADCQPRSVAEGVTCQLRSGAEGVTKGLLLAQPLL